MNASREGSASSPGAQDPIGAYLLRALEGPEEEWEANVARACEEHPEWAAGIRRRFARLKALGFEREGGFARETRPERVGDFRLLEHLGSGGMGVVHLAEQESLGRRVALKLIRTAAMHEPRARERFRREVEAASRLDHPGICTVYEAGEVDGTPYIAMRYVEGETLAQRIARAREVAERGDDTTSSAGTTHGELDTTLAIFEKAARALHAAHEAGLVHRDVKPGNLMITPAGEPVILDFGLARIEDSEAGTLTRSSSSLGTPAYMSPEQVSGSAHDVDRRTDVYSLGVALYEALTLRRPFEAPTREGLYRCILESAPPDPRSVDRRLPRELAVVLETALEKESGRRYQTALHLAEELRRIRAREPIQARPTGPWLRSRRWVQRNPVGAALIGVLAMGLAVTSVLLRQVADERNDKELALTRARSLALASAAADEVDEDPVLAVLLAREAFRLRRDHETRSRLLDAVSSSHERRRLQHPAALASATYSPSGDRILTAANEVAYLWSAGGELLRELHPRESWLVGARFSPDGSRILATTRGGSAWLWDAEGRPVAELPTPAGVDWGVVNLIGSRAAAFSPDGQLVGVGDRAGTVRLFDCDGVLRAVLAGEHAGAVLCVAFSPEGLRVASGSRDGRVVVRKVDGEVLQRIEHGADVGTVAFSPEGGTLLSASADGTARLTDLIDGSQVFSVDGGGGGVHSARFSPDGQRVAVSSRAVRLLDVEGGLLWAREYEASVWDVQFSPDGRLVVGCCNEGFARVHDLEGRLVAELRGHQDRMTSAVFSPTGERVVTASIDGTAREWAVDGAEFPTWPGDGQAVSALAVSPNGERVATGSRSGVGRLCDGGGRMLTPLDAGSAFCGLNWSVSGDRLASCHADGTVRLWDAAGACLGSFQVGSGRLESVAFSPDGARIVVAGGELRRVSFLSVDGDALEREAELTTRRYYYDARFAPDGEILIAVAVDQVLLWSAGGELLDTLRLSSNRDALRTVDFSPDGERALVGLRTGEVVELEVAGAELRELGRFRGLGKSVHDVAYSPSGQLVAAGSREGTVRLWTSDREPLVTMHHGGMVWSIAFTPDGSHVLSTSSLGTTRLWPVPTDELLLELAAERATRGFLPAEIAEYADLLGPRVVPAEVDAVTSESLNRASWAVAREPGHSAEEYALARRRAERADEVRPGMPHILNTLGAARYRAGRCRDAIAALSRAEAAHRSSGQPADLAYDLVFLALCHKRLGEEQRARQLLDELQALELDETDAELARLVAEAREVLAGGGPPP